MRDLFKRLFSESVVYGLSGLISSFISIFLIPLYTRVFDPADYGIISLLLSTFAFLNILIIFSHDYAIAVWFWDKPGEQERKSTFNSWAVFLLAAGLSICLLIILLGPYLSELYFGTKNYYILFVFLGFNLLLTGFQKLANIWFRMLQKPLQAMIYSIAIMLITVGCNILFVLKLKVGIVGVFYSQAIGSVAGVLLLILFLYKWLNLRFFSWQHLKEMLRFAAPMVPATILFWLMNTASVFFIKYYIKDNTQIGLFQIGMNVANVLGLFTWAFFQAWPAFAMSVSKQENAKKIYSIIFEIFCLGGAFMAFSLFLVAEDILLIFTNVKYVSARDVIGILAINIILQGIPNIFAIANMITKNNRSYAVAISIGAILSVLSFMIFIPMWGKEGAALAMVIGNLFVPVYMGIRLRKIYYIPYNMIRITAFIIIQIVLFGIASLLGHGFFLHIMFILIIGFMLVLAYIKTIKKGGIINNALPKTAVKLSS